MNDDRNNEARRMAKHQTTNYVTKDTRVTASFDLWQQFDFIMDRRGCRTRAEKFREAMRMIVRGETNGVVHGSGI